jgi:hypothetical protein
MRRLLGIALPALVSIVLVAGPAVVLMAGPASAAASHRIGNCHASGVSVRCLVKGTATRPRTIHVHLSASPSQRLLIRWHMTCSKGMSIRKSHGRIHARTPIRRKLHHPFSHPGSCIVTARTHLPGHGRIHLWLTSRR